MGAVKDWENYFRGLYTRDPIFGGSILGASDVLENSHLGKVWLPRRMKGGRGLGVAVVLNS